MAPVETTVWKVLSIAVNDEPAAAKCQNCSHRGAVDRHIEDAFPGRSPIDLGEFQSDIVGAVRDSKLISEVTVALRLVERWIRSTRDGMRRRRRAATCKILIGAPNLCQAICIGSPTRVDKDRREWSG